MLGVRSEVDMGCDGGREENAGKMAEIPISGFVRGSGLSEDGRTGGRPPRPRQPKGVSKEREEGGRGTFLFAFLSCTDSCFSKMRACKLTKVGNDLVVWANSHSLGILP